MRKTQRDPGTRVYEFQRTAVQDLPPKKRPVLTREPIQSPVLQTEEAAAYLGLSPWKIRELVHNGELAYIKDCGKWRFLKSDLDEYLLRHRFVA